MNHSVFTSSLLIAAVVIFSCEAHLFASGSDAKIESSANDTYVFKTFLKDDKVVVASKEGVVTLSGFVSDESHKQLAQQTVASLPGVKSVVNKLEVKGDIPAAYTDAWLITKVKLTLLFHKNVNATATEVAVSNGVVTLRGEAASAAQKDLTTEYAKDVEGVKGVNNEMKISSASSKPGEMPMAEKMGALKDSVDDASITALVKATLLYHRSTSALSTTVETKDGVVSLGGKASNAAEKDLATKLVTDVHGVKKVVNNMVLE